MMPLEYQDRHIGRAQRLDRLLGTIPPQEKNPLSCPDCQRLLKTLVDEYGETPSSLRKLQRDLKILIEEEQIEAITAGGKPRYRRIGSDVDDPIVLQYILEQVRDLVSEAVPTQQFDRLWQKLQAETKASGPILDEKHIRIVPDALRLKPVALYEGVLRAVIEALVRRCALQVKYCDANDVVTEAQLHAQGLVKRGPIPYLFALKNDEEEPLRLYALHRMIRAESLIKIPVREMPGFNLDKAIAQGQVDFGQGETIHLVIRVRGYMETLLRDCVLPDQTINDEPEGSNFSSRISARVPSTGQLLRWLLGAGDNIEVLEPANLRNIVAAQSAKTARLYRKK